MRTIVWDIEIAKPLPIKKGKPDWEAAKRGECGISAVVLWDSATERFHLYDSHSLEQCMVHLNSADLLVGFNSVEFDTRVIEAITGMEIQAQQFDILLATWKALGDKHFKGYKLGDICHRTIGLEKSGHGEGAPSLAKQGRWGELFDYCLNDVHITKELYNHIVDTGWILDVNGLELPLDVPSDEFA